MADFIYPSNAELQLIAQQLMPTLTMNDPIFNEFKIVEEDADILLWEQEDYYTGTQQIRGLNGEAGRVKQVGLTRFMADPGVYGEYMLLDERDLTRRRQFGTFGTAVDVTDLVLKRQRQLLHRRITRIQQIAWSLASTGTYSVSQNVGGQSFILATDTYTLQSYTASVTWGTYATATPLADFRQVQLKQRGYSVSFGSDATIYMNQGTFNNLAKNTNASDIYGRRTAGLGTFESLDQINTLLVGDNLPKIVVYDGNYRDDTGTIQLLIPNNTAVVFGRRLMGDPIGEYRMTRNASNPGMAPGPYMGVKDNLSQPRQIAVHDGHNGGPVVFQPNGICIMNGL